MTAEEKKARELVEKFSIKATVIYSENSIPCVVHDKLGFKSSKQCALIAVEEIIEAYNMANVEYEDGAFIKFYQEVKQEINKL